MEYAVSNIAFYHTLALFGCGSNLKDSSHMLQKHIQRGLQYNQNGMVKSMAIYEQMTFDLMGLEKNAYDSHYGGLNEDAVLDMTIKNKVAALTRTLNQKIRYVKYMCGDMDAAAKHYDLQQELYANCAGQATNGRTVFFFITTFIDGLIGLYFARKHRDDEAKWTGVAETAIEHMTKWTKSCSWNFANKLSLLQAEYFFLKDDEQAYSCYKASIKQAREHRFNHEEGLAHEKLATYLLHKSNHDEALQHFQDAKKCYETWHAHVLVRRIEKAIAVLSPLCTATLPTSPNCVPRR
jgi:tetratricopeptide (TPR) repeat protein